ncbi:MAG: hypothetical protein AABN34_18680 [Acidobacteriota bacterium]
MLAILLALTVTGYWLGSVNAGNLAVPIAASVSSAYLTAVLPWTEAHIGQGASAVNRSVNGNRLVSREPRVTVEVDPALKYIGRLEFDIRDAAHAERVVFADADAKGNVRRLFIVQFESMLPDHQGSYDFASSNPVRIGPYDFNEAVGKYEFAASIKAKPGAEAELTREFLAQKGLRVDAPLFIARYETTTDQQRRSEMVIFYWEDRAIAGIEGIADRAKRVFRISAE